MTSAHRPLRILMMIHTPWSRDLGAPRVQLELGEELRSLGHTVEKFSYEDAFPAAGDGPASGFRARLNAYLRSNRSFAARARSYVRAHAGRFDVIDANQTDLPFSKRELGFRGLLVVRSVGLIPAYREFERDASRRWPEPVSAKQMVRDLLVYPGVRRRCRDVDRSFRCADLINVSNGDDLARVAGEMGFGSKVVLLPFGLPTARQEAFLRARASVADRLASQTVAFIGAWNSRKGSRDWPSIVREVRRRRPATRFRFLGTGYDRGYVLRGFAPPDHAAIEVVPAYASDDLPGLLAPATVGAFPGYLEGFGIAVLEKLAAGLPVVAYDAPGPRDMLRRRALAPMVPAGDGAGFADLVLRFLALAPEPYGELADESVQVAAQFSWPEIARRTASLYTSALARVIGDGETGS